MVSVAWAGGSGWSQLAGQSSIVATIPPGNYGDSPFLAWGFSVGVVVGSPTTRTVSLLFTDLTSVTLPTIQAGSNLGAFVVPGSTLNQGATIVVTSTGGAGTNPDYGALSAALVSWDSSVVGNPVVASQLMPGASSGSDATGTLNPAFFGTSVTPSTPFAIGVARINGSTSSVLTFVNADSPWCTDAADVNVDYSPSLSAGSRYQQAVTGVWINQDPLAPNYHYHLSNAPSAPQTSVGRFFFPTAGPAVPSGWAAVIG